MLASLGIVLLSGLIVSALCRKIHLPHIVGLLAAGIALGPYGLNVLDSSFLNSSSELRQMALVIVLIKAGLSLSVSDLKKNGRPAWLLSFVPAIFEIIACTLLAPLFFGCTLLEGAIMGTVLGAASTTVIVPRMVTLLEKGYGTKRRIPQIIMTGTSLNNVISIALFSILVCVGRGKTAQARDYIDILVSVFVGIGLGVAAGWLTALYFDYCHRQKKKLRNTLKTIIVLGLACLLMGAENLLGGKISVSGLLAALSMAVMLRIKCRLEISQKLSEKLGKIWLAAEIILFALTGAAMDIRYTLKIIVLAVVLIAVVLAIRSLGVMASLLETKANRKERLFCVVSDLPKGAVQAAVGSVPMAMGLSCGNLILTVAVLSILISAPLGAIAMDKSYRKLLHRKEVKTNT